MGSPGSLDATLSRAYSQRVAPLDHTPDATAANVSPQAIGRRRSATGAEQERRKAWGREWAQVGKAVGQQIREGR